MSLNAVFQGPPANVPSPGAAAALGLDEVNGNLYYTSPQSSGWQPIGSATASASASAQTGADATLLVYTVPATGLYKLSGYEAQATSTNGTLPNMQAAWTEGTTGVAVSATTFVTGTATTGQGQYDQGSLIVNAKVGTTITVSTTAPTTLTYNAAVSIESLG